MTFPFETVYDYFARRLVDVGLPAGGRDFPPFLATVKIEEGKIAGVDVMDVAMFFQAKNGKELLSSLISRAVPMLPTGAALVMMMEAWHKEQNVSAPRPGSLENDPDASEVVMISIYTATGQRIGALPIDKDRNVAYAPLRPEPQYSEGRFVVQQPAPADATKH